MSPYDWSMAMTLRQAAPEEIEQVRLKALRRHLAHAATVPYFRDLFHKHGLVPERAQILDLRDIPLLDRREIEATPQQFVPRPAPEIVDIAMTSGTTGKPMVVPYTAADLDRLAFNEEMGFRAAGITAADRALLTVTLDRCFIAGLAYYSGLTRLGATVIRSGPGQSARQWELINRFRPTVLVGVPSFLMALAAKGKALGFTPKEAGINKLVTIGEPLRRYDHSLTLLGRDLSRIWGAELFSSYGSTEMETAACECSAGIGAHIHPELLLVEIVDEAGKVVADGKPGEVIVTPMGVSGLPLVRFKTGDIARIHRDPCPCGLNSERLGAIEGRLAQRLKVKGTTIYPEMIFQALQERKEVGPVYIEVRNAYDLADEITVIAACDDHGVSERELADLLRSRLRLRPEVKIKPKREVIAAMNADGGRKPKKFFDFRKKDI